MKQTRAINRSLPRNDDGFVLIATAVCLPVIVGMLGLTVDVGRLYIVKTELQSYADSAAIAAAYELNGTSQGITNAITVAQSGSNGGTSINRWNFGTQTLNTPQVAFAQTFGGSYTSSPASGTNYLFAQVTASEAVNLYFLPIFPNVSANRTVSATAIAGQGVRSSLGDGLSPFSPDAHNPIDPNFGFVAGTQYTLKWAPPGQRKNGNKCGGDLGFTPGGGSSDRGYIDVGQGNGNSALRDAVVNNDYSLATPLAVGGSITMVTGNKSVGPAVTERFNQDTDTNAATYSTYRGNGRRIIIVAVNNSANPALVDGFAAFFLPPNSCGASNTSPCCGEYLGPAVAFGKQKGGSSTGGLYAVTLFN